MTDAAYGKRFLSALRREFRSTASLSYPTLVAIESADRDGLVALLSGVRTQPPAGVVKSAAVAMPPIRESLVELARTAEPEALARAFATELRRLHTQRVSRQALGFYGFGFVSDLLGVFWGD